MGIDGLWKALEPVSEKRSLKEYALTQSRHENEDQGLSLRPIIVGIDASIWMNESQAAFFHRCHAQMGENPELCTLFYCLAHLLEICIIPVFVFDGPSRPSKKRGKRVITQPHWLTKRFKELIHAFGFYSHMAPGEAEAELAALNYLGIFNAVMTEDSDAFVFGAKCVIRKSDNKAKPDEVRIYSADQARQKLNIEQNDFIFMAILCGGDYDKAGLAGCGIEIASQLAGLRMGDTFHDAACLPQPEIEVKLEACRSVLRNELLTNASGYLHHRHPSLAKKIEDSFPSISTLRWYVEPAISDLKFLNMVAWVPQMPNVGKMFRICEELFSWGTLDGILKKFKSVVWTGVCSRQLVQFQCDTNVDVIVIPMSSFLSTKAPARPCQNSTVQYYDVKVRLDMVISSSLSFLRYTRKSESAANTAQLIESYSTFTAKIPTLVVRCGLPDLPKLPTKKSKSTRVASYPRLDIEHEVIDLTS